MTFGYLLQRFFAERCVRGIEPQVSDSEDRRTKLGIVAQTASPEPASEAGSAQGQAFDPANPPPESLPSEPSPPDPMPAQHPAGPPGQTSYIAPPGFQQPGYQQPGMQQPGYQQPGPVTRSFEVETLSGRFIWISLWRAFRLQIHTHEVLASERRTLEADAKHIVDPEQQAFLAWRRSVLLVVAIFFVPLTLVRLIEAFDGPSMPTFARIFVLFPAITEGIFCAVAFDQLKNWTRWQKQRRILFIAWSIYMLAPFLVYLYPFRNAFEESYQAARQLAELGGMKLRVKRSTVDLAVGLVFGVKAQLILAPKVISLMPGLIRASIVSKLLFPGMTAPGWLMLLAAPLYALFAYIMVLLPYQITGQWFFVAGNAGLMIAQIFIGWSGRALTVPLQEDEARGRIHRSWLAYIGMMTISAGFMLYGLHDFITQLNLGVIRIVSGVLGFIANVLLLTLIGTDLIVSGMAYFRRRVLPDARREELMRQSEAKLDRFST